MGERVREVGGAGRDKGQGHGTGGRGRRGEQGAEQELWTREGEPEARRVEATIVRQAEHDLQPCLLFRSVGGSQQRALQHGATTPPLTTQEACESTHSAVEQERFKRMFQVATHLSLEGSSQEEQAGATTPRPPGPPGPPVLGHFGLRAEPCV